MARPISISPTRLTKRLWSKLQSKASDTDDNCHIEHSSYGVMVHHLFRWQASIYKLLWLDALIWCLLYAGLSLIYRLAPLSLVQKQAFEDVVRSVGIWSRDIPLTFLLGFFVSNIVTRWWDMYLLIPKIGGVSTVIRTCILNRNSESGLRNSERAQNLRRSVSRYLNLAWVLCFWHLSGHLRNRFHILRNIIASVNQVEPESERERHIKHNDLFNFRRKYNDPLRQHLSEIRVTEQMQTDNISLMLQDLSLLNEDPVVKETYGDLITSSEVEIFHQQALQLQRQKRTGALEAEVAQFGPGPELYSVQWWLPLHWALALVEQSAEEGFVMDTGIYLTATSAIQEFGSALTNLTNYATRSLPLVYTQVATISVYTIFLITALSKQFIDPASASDRSITGYWVDYYVPVFGFLQMMFLVGWLKVALVVLDPFGTDDDDFLLGSVMNGNLRSGVVMSTNKSQLYPKKLRHLVEMHKHSDAAGTDCLHSDAEDEETVVLQAEMYSKRGRVYYANALFEIEDH